MKERNYCVDSLSTCRGCLAGFQPAWHLSRHCALKQQPGAFSVSSVCSCQSCVLSTLWLLLSSVAGKMRTLCVQNAPKNANAKFLLPQSEAFTTFIREKCTHFRLSPSLRLCVELQKCHHYVTTFGTANSLLPSLQALTNSALPLGDIFLLACTTEVTRWLTSQRSSL
jgi:hypothetical protein